MLKGMELPTYLGELIVAGGGLAAAVTAYKKGQSTIKTTHLDSVEKAVKIWENTSDKLVENMDVLREELKAIKQNHEDCERTKNEQGKLITLLDSRVAELTEAIHRDIETPIEIRKGLNRDGK